MTLCANSDDDFLADMATMRPSGSRLVALAGDHWDWVGGDCICRHLIRPDPKNLVGALIGLIVSRSSECLLHRFGSVTPHFFGESGFKGMPGHEIKVGPAHFHLGAPSANASYAVPLLKMFAPASQLCRVFGQ